MIQIMRQTWSDGDGSILLGGALGMIKD